MGRAGVQPARRSRANKPSWASGAIPGRSGHAICSANAGPPQAESGTRMLLGGKPPQAGQRPSPQPLRDEVRLLLLLRAALQLQAVGAALLRRLVDGVHKYVALLVDCGSGRRRRPKAAVRVECSTTRARFSGAGNWKTRGRVKGCDACGLGRHGAAAQAPLGNTLHCRKPLLGRRPWLGSQQGTHHHAEW